jgi:hypothetical protein
LKVLPIVDVPAFGCVHYPRGFPPIFLKIGEAQPNLEFQLKLDFIM